MGTCINLLNLQKMYRINELKRKTLIVPDEVLFHIASDNNPDYRYVLQNIIVAEERFIAPTLGRTFYNLLLDQKNKVVTPSNQALLLTEINASYLIEGKDEITIDDIPVGTIINSSEWLSVDNRELWDILLWKLTSECVDVTLIPNSWLRHTAQGQQKNNPEVIGGNGSNSVTGDIKDVKYKVDVAIRDRIDPLTESLKSYLSESRNKYPLAKDYRDIGKDGVSTLRKTEWVFNAYEDEKSCGCNIIKHN